MDVNVNKSIIIKSRKEIFYSIYFMLLPFCIIILGILLSVEYFKNNKVYSIEKILIAVSAIAVIPVVLSIFFVRNGIFLDDEKIIYQTLFRKKTLRLDEIEYSRFEFGYKDRSEKNVPSHRFVVYPKSNVNKPPIVINFTPLESIKKVVEKFESIGKLQPEIDYSETS